MDRRSLLRGLIALPVAGALNACDDSPKEASQPPKSTPGTLKVVLDGAFAVVVQTNNRGRIRVFTPRDPENRHHFHFLDGSAKGDPMRSGASGQRYNFELPPDGLKAETKTEIDPKLSAFAAQTDLWCQEDYFVTIDLPAPRKISFMPPLFPAVLAKSKKEVCMARNHILEYEATDLNKIKMTWQGEPFGPMPCAELIKRYQKGCEELKKGRTKGERGERDHRVPPFCTEQQAKFYETACPDNAVTFFFGVGLSPSEHDPGHAVQFFNNEILRSFPHLKQLELSSVRPDDTCKSDASQSSAKQTQENWRLREAVSIDECQVSGPVVTFPATQGG